MVTTMVAANVLKGGGCSIFLSSRRFSCGPPHPLYTYCPSLYYSLLKPKENRNWNLGRLSTATNVAATAPRVFCTASNVADSAAVPTASSDVVDKNNDRDLDDDLKTIRDAANTLDIRVGRILRARRHEDADSLYVEEVDVGEPQPRIICSGLANYIQLDHLQDKKVIVLANLKPRNMRGVKSFGMLMAASDASHENVELLLPPEGSLPGERVWFGSEDEKENLPDAATPNQIQKKKIWELVQPHLKTDASSVATLGMHYMRTSAGVVVCGSLKNASIS
ncbi:unnamed protein product [Ilex paraguariensis]|uniref:tRNA-binding domain-containing protein n=1 Tax=Ilex paraguariensis TaxID=185542 RepID=A0ABC8SL10_9AQUA